MHARLAHFFDTETATITRESPSTVRHWRHEGKLPTVRIGRRAAVPREALVDFLRRAGSNIGDHNIDAVLAQHRAAASSIERAA